MQSQQNFSDNIVVPAASRAATVNRVYWVGDTLGIARDSVDIGERLVVQTAGEHGSVEIVPGETWGQGQRMYWHETLSVFTSHQTHWPVGHAGRGKVVAETWGSVQLVAPERVGDQVVAPFNYDTMTAARAQGDYLLREFGASMRIVQAELVSSGLAPNTTTVALGNGTGANDQVLAATAVSALSGFDDVGALVGGTVPAVVDKLVLRVGAADFTAGFLAVRVAYVPA